MKKTFIALSLIISVLLSGCFGSDTTKPADKKIDGFTLNSTDEFSIQIPNEWEIFKPEELKDYVAKNTLAAFRSNVRNATFTANVVVLKNDITVDANSLSYSGALQRKMEQELLGYKTLLSEKTVLTVGGAATDATYMYVEGRQSAESDFKRFIATAAVKGKIGYVVLGAFLPSEGEAMAKKIETIIKSFEVK